MSTMTDKEAYAAMFHFLESIYKRTGSNELGGLLGSMSVLADGSPADPAVAGDWQEAVTYALKGGPPGSLKLHEL